MRRGRLGTGQPRSTGRSVCDTGAKKKTPQTKIGREVSVVKDVRLRRRVSLPTVWLCLTVQLPHQEGSSYIALRPNHNKRGPATLRRTHHHNWLRSTESKFFVHAGVLRTKSVILGPLTDLPTPGHRRAEPIPSYSTACRFRAIRTPFTSTWLLSMSSWLVISLFTNFRARFLGKRNSTASERSLPKEVGVRGFTTEKS